MGEITEGVNWLAVIVGAVVAYGLGWLWYSPVLFGTKWMEGTGVKMEAGSPLPMGAMIVQAIGTFLLAWVVGVTAVGSELMTFILYSWSPVTACMRKNRPMRSIPNAAISSPWPSLCFLRKGSFDHAAAGAQAPAFGCHLNRMSGNPSSLSPSVLWTSLKPWAA